MIEVIVTSVIRVNDENSYGTDVYRIEFETEVQYKAWLEQAKERPYNGEMHKLLTA